MKKPPFRPTVYLTTAEVNCKGRVDGLPLTWDITDGPFRVLLRIRSHPVPWQTYQRRRRLFVSRRHRWQGSPWREYRAAQAAYFKGRPVNLGKIYTY